MCKPEKFWCRLIILLLYYQSFGDKGAIENDLTQVYLNNDKLPNCFVKMVKKCCMPSTLTPLVKRRMLKKCLIYWSFIFVTPPGIFHRALYTKSSMTNWHVEYFDIKIVWCFKINMINVGAIEHYFFSLNLFKKIKVFFL